jgi:hypothetical protein
MMLLDTRRLTGAFLLLSSLLQGLGMRTKWLVALAVVLVACSPDAVVRPLAVPSSAQTVRHYPKPVAFPAALTIAVGQSVTVKAAYPGTLGFWGCSPQPSCWDLVAILPNAGATREETGQTAVITGLAAGQVTIYESTGLDTNGDGLLDKATFLLTIVP